MAVSRSRATTPTVRHGVSPLRIAEAMYFVSKRSTTFAHRSRSACVASVSAPAPRSPYPMCVGDCDLDGMTTLAEAASCIDIALGEEGKS